MIGLIIAAAVLIVLALILAGRVTIIFDFDGELYLKVSYLFITLIGGRSSARKRKPRKKRKSKSKSEKDSEDEKSSEKPSLSDFLTLARVFLDSLGKPLKKVLKRTKITRLRLDIVCGGEDAAKAAINYGKMNILVGNCLGLADAFFTLRSTDAVNIGVDFYLEETTTSAYCEARLSLASALALMFSFIGRLSTNFTANKDAKAALKKAL